MENHNRKNDVKIGHLNPNAFTTIGTGISRTFGILSLLGIASVMQAAHAEQSGVSGIPGVPSVSGVSKVSVHKGPESSEIAPDPALEPAVDHLSDAELTDLAADWSTLDDDQRTEVVQETRDRMRPATEPRAGREKLERRRYGRLVRQADGTVLRIEAQVTTRQVAPEQIAPEQRESQIVRLRRRDPQRAYGMGFERRRNVRQASAVPAPTGNGVESQVLGDRHSLQNPNQGAREPGLR